MSSAVKTPNLGLPQWVTGEKPERADFNAAFLTLDAMTPSDGWIDVQEAFAYASATTITVATGAASRWQISDRIKFTQHGVVKYFFVSSVSDTLIVVICQTAEVVENTGTYAITAISYSRVANPFGFPKGEFVQIPIAALPSNTNQTSYDLPAGFTRANSIPVGFRSWTATSDATMYDLASSGFAYHYYPGSFALISSTFYGKPATAIIYRYK